MTVSPGGGSNLPAMVGAKVLLVDDDDAIRELVGIWLVQAGFQVFEAEDGKKALELASSVIPDLVILDVMMPEVSGIDVLKQLRDISDVGIIMLTARSTESDRVRGLALGADDYIVKPFSLSELVERVRSVLRRTAVRAKNVQPLEFGELALDLESHELTLRGSNIPVTQKEFELLRFLMASPGKVFTRDQLLRSVWRSSVQWQDPATVTEHIHRLRMKIEDDPSKPEWIQTVRGVGYRFDRRLQDQDDSRSEDERRAAPGSERSSA